MKGEGYYCVAAQFLCVGVIENIMSVCVVVVVCDGPVNLVSPDVGD